MLVAILWVLAIYFVISVFVWPFQVGRTQVYTVGYAWTNVLACAILAVVLFCAIAEVS